MNVVLLHNGGTGGLPSGETVVFHDEAAALRELGCHVHSLCVENRIGISAQFRHKVRQANVFWSSRAYALTRRLISDHQPDIVHVHSVLPNLTVSVFAACRDANVPVVQTLHNYRWICVEGGLFRNAAFCDDCLTKGSWPGVKHRCSRGSAIASSLLTLNNQVFVNRRRLFQYVDRFIAVSQFLKDRHVQGGFPADKITVKYNGVAIPAETAKLDSQRAVITFVGRLDVAKGTSILTRLPELMRTRHDVDFKIAGAGPDEQQLRASLREYPNVEFTGRLARHQVGELMLQSHCVVVPSLVPESFGLAAAEAMSCGVPVLASRLGGLTELMEQSQAGVLVDPSRGEIFVAGVFADELHKLLRAPGELARLGQRGRAFAEERLRIDRTTGQLREIYQAVIEQRGNNQLAGTAVSSGVAENKR